MKKLIYSIIVIITLAVMGIVCTAQASLIPKLGGTVVYDTDRNITWLANANLNNGGMNWITANDWAASLNVGGFTDWRLPTTLQPDANCGIQSGGDSYGYNCTGSELGHLFYQELGGQQGQLITTVHNANFNLFSHIQVGIYWSGTKYAPLPDLAWNFITSMGFQTFNYEFNQYYLWAVRSGDVIAVPEPSIAWLLGAGLLGWYATVAQRRG